MKSFYNDEALLVFNDLLYKKRRELSDIRKYKFNSKFRSTQRQSESPNEYHNKGPESLLPVVNRDKNKKTPKYYLNFVQLASIMILKFAVEYGELKIFKYFRFLNRNGVHFPTLPEIGYP